MDNYVIIEDIFNEEPVTAVDTRKPITEHIPEDILQSLPRESKQVNQARVAPSNTYSVSSGKDYSHLPPTFQQSLDLQALQRTGKFQTERYTTPLNLVSNGMHCKEVYEHVNTCPVCQSYYKKDFKFYWLIIGILIVIIAIIVRSK